MNTGSKMLALGVVSSVLIVSVFLCWNKITSSGAVVSEPVSNTLVAASNLKGAKNATYSVEGLLVTLTDGTSEAEVTADPSSKITTRYFGNEVQHDFNNDGREDTAFLLTQNSGGSGTFYYLVVALNYTDGYFGSSAYFLGDRIAPQSTYMSSKNGEATVVVVNFADRKEGEPFTVLASQGKSVSLVFDVKTMQFSPVK